MLSSLPNAFNSSELGGNYLTNKELLYPTRHVFFPKLIPLDKSIEDASSGLCSVSQGSKFARKIAEDYRCLSGYFTNDCCSQKCGTNQGIRVQDYQVASANYQTAIPLNPVNIGGCSVRTK